ncbi:MULTISPECIES: hypothetical protein [Helcococcus]|uniref:DUF5067 domain-containing protein n=1 Tax=Helcococcus bovis TaxID=3153252 RepID=A0ABW9F3S8_9FIRM
MRKLSVDLVSGILAFGVFIGSGNNFSFAEENIKKENEVISKIQNNSNIIEKDQYDIEISDIDKISTVTLNYYLKNHTQSEAPENFSFTIDNNVKKNSQIEDKINTSISSNKLLIKNARNLMKYSELTLVLTDKRREQYGATKIFKLSNSESKNNLNDTPSLPDHRRQGDDIAGLGKYKFENLTLDKFKFDLINEFLINNLQKKENQNNGMNTPSKPSNLKNEKDNIMNSPELKPTPTKTEEMVPNTPRNPETGKESENY